MAFLHGGIKSGISVYFDGQSQVIVDINTPAPGSTGTFGGFLESSVLDGRNIDFGGGTEVGSGIFAYIDGEVELVANKNSVVPGHEDTTFTNFHFSDGVRPSISGENVVFFGDGLLPGKQIQSIDGIYARIHEPPIPAASTWGLIVLSLLLLTTGILLIRGRPGLGCDRSAM